MRKPRFNIASLLLVVLVVAVGVAALRDSNEIWDNVLFTLTVGVLLISVLLTIHCTGKRRAFWMGFAVFGAVYLGLSLVPSIESRLVTTKALGYLDSKVFRPVTGGAAYPRTDSSNDGELDLYVVNNWQSKALDPSKGSGMFQAVTTITALGASAARSMNFMRIGHSLFALFIGFLGGQLSHLCYDRAHRSRGGAGAAPRQVGRTPSP